MENPSPAAEETLQELQEARSQGQQNTSGLSGVDFLITHAQVMKNLDLDNSEPDIEEIDLLAPSTLTFGVGGDAGGDDWTKFYGPRIRD